jgi:hypothetical protein
MRQVRFGWRLRQVARTFPAYWIAMCSLAVLAWCSAVYPLGVRADVQSPGMVGGLWLGLGAALIGAVPAAAGMVLAGVGGDEETGMAGVHRALGVRPGPRAIAWIVVTMTLIVDWSVVGAVAGALVGLGRGLATSGGLVGSGHVVSVRAALIAIGAAGYISVIAAAGSARLKGRTEAAITFGAGALAFFALLGVVPPGSPARWLLRVTPFGPLWSAALPPGHSALVLSMSGPARVAVTAGWLVSGVVSLALSSRRAQPASRLARAT